LPFLLSHLIVGMPGLSSTVLWKSFLRDADALIPFSFCPADQERLDFDAKKLQSYVKEKSFIISEKGVLADRISPGVVKSLVTLTDNNSK